MLVPKLRFKEFNNNWNNEKISNAFALSSGSTPNTKQRFFYTGNINWVSSGELKRKYIVDTINKVSNIAIEKNNLKIYDIGTLLIAIYGLEASGVRGTCSILNIKATISQACMALESKNNISNEFMYYWYQKNGQWIGLRIAQGTKQQNLTAELIGNLEVEYPSIDEQEKIVNFLSLLDKKIELQKQKIEALKIYKKGLIQELFSFNTFYEKKLEDICNITTGKLDANAMTLNGKYRFYTCAKEYYRINIYAFDTEALLISGNGAYVGYIHYYKGKFNAYQRTYVLDKFSENILYIKYYLDTFLAKRILAERKEGNTPYIVLNTLAKMTIIFPSSKVQNQIVSTLIKFDTKLDLENKKLDKLHIIKKSLLQQMFI